jgi:hypothetical protein
VLKIVAKNYASNKASKKKTIEKSNNQPAHNEKDPANDKDGSLLRLIATTAHCSWIFPVSLLFFQTGLECLALAS